MKNILNEDERENSGLDTQLRFNYQTDWAITYLLNKILGNEEFVLFMEYHEDIICSNSISLHNEIEFEFYQIKTTAKNFNLENICKFEPSSKINSIIGKMILSIENKIFKKSVKKLCLLTTSDINFNEKINTMGDYKYLKDLTEEEINKIFENLKIELQEIDSGYKDIICFQKANLPFQSSESTTKGKISEFIEQKYGSIRSNISNIYRALWDDLRIKHDYKLPFERWDECVVKRGLNSDEVSSILAENIELDISESLKNFIENYLQEYNKIQKTFIPIQINSINQYYMYLLTNRSIEFNKEIDKIRSLIILPDDILNAENYSNMISEIDLHVNSHLLLKGLNKMKAVSTYEVLNRIYNELTKN